MSGIQNLESVSDFFLTFFILSQETSYFYFVTKDIDTSGHVTREQAEPLLQVFNYIHPMSMEAEMFLIENLYPVVLKKGKKLHKAGGICDQVFFVVKGAVRGFIKEGNKDSTTWITIENEMVVAIYSFMNQVPTIENMEAIEDCFLLGLSHVNLQKMYVDFPEVNILSRKILEKYYSDAEIRALIARLKKAENKYAYFLETYPQLSNRIPLKCIASFLGINLETLSRVRAQKGHTGK